VGARSCRYAVRRRFRRGIVRRRRSCDAAGWCHGLAIVRRRPGSGQREGRREVGPARGMHPDRTVRSLAIESPHCAERRRPTGAETQDHRTEGAQRRASRSPRQPPPQRSRRTPRRGSAAAASRRTDASGCRSASGPGWVPASGRSTEHHDLMTTAEAPAAKFAFHRQSRSGARGCRRPGAGQRRHPARERGAGDDGIALSRP